MQQRAMDFQTKMLCPPDLYYLSWAAVFCLEIKYCFQVLRPVILLMTFSIPFISPLLNLCLSVSLPLSSFLLVCAFSLFPLLAIFLILDSFLSSSLYCSWYSSPISYSLDNAVTITVCCISTYLSSSLPSIIPKPVFMVLFPITSHFTPSSSLSLILSISFPLSLILL